jgi:membrane protein implicated in regulation of membrane protease activity
MRPPREAEGRTLKNDQKEGESMETGVWFKDRTLGLQALFIMIIAYAVSTTFVFCVALGVLPHLHYKFYLRDNIPYAITAFALAALTGVYHLRLMFHRRKRQSDRAGNGRAEAAHWFKDRSVATRTIFVLLVLYAPCAIIGLVLLFRVVPYIPQARIPYASITYAIVSFVLAALISAYHLSTLIRRQKRKTDRPGGEGA